MRYRFVPFAFDILPVYGNVIGLEQYRDQNSCRQSFTVKDNSLQVLQNNLNRLLLNANYATPTEVLKKETNSLSIQQVIAYHTTVLAYKVMKTGKPSYIAERMQRMTVGRNTRGSTGKIVVHRRKLEISSEGRDDFVLYVLCKLLKIRLG